MLRRLGARKGVQGSLRESPALRLIVYDLPRGAVSRDNSSNSNLKSELIAHIDHKDRLYKVNSINKVGFVLSLFLF